jgi:uncharacterized protein (DUF736 family)
MENKYLNSGALFTNNNKTSDKAPDFKGDIELDSELVGQLAAAMRDGKPMKLDLAGWRRTSSKGTTFLSVKVSKPYERTGGSTSAPRQASKAPWE